MIFYCNILTLSNLLCKHCSWNWLWKKYVQEPSVSRLNLFGRCLTLLCITPLLYLTTFNFSTFLLFVLLILRTTTTFFKHTSVLIVSSRKIIVWPSWSFVLTCSYFVEYMELRIICGIEVCNFTCFLSLSLSLSL